MDKIYHITWATKYSRASNRLIQLGIKKAKTKEPIILTPEMRTFAHKTLTQKIVNKRYNVIALNVLPDHVHCILICENTSRSNIIKILKGYSAYMLAKHFRFSNSGQGQQSNIWEKRHNYKVLKSLQQILTVTRYILNNHDKHKSEPLTYEQPIKVDFSLP